MTASQTGSHSRALHPPARTLAAASTSCGSDRSDLVPVTVRPAAQERSRPDRNALHRPRKGCCHPSGPEQPYYSHQPRRWAPSCGTTAHLRAPTCSPPRRPNPAVPRTANRESDCPQPRGRSPRSAGCTRCSSFRPRRRSPPYPDRWIAPCVSDLSDSPRSGGSRLLPARLSPPQTSYQRPRFDTWLY